MSQHDLQHGSVHGSVHDSAHGHGHGHDDHGHDDGIHFSGRDYLIGFVLSVVLTAIPFWLVMGKVIASPAVTAAVILAIGAVQIVVQMVYFLHMNTRVQGGWSMLALIFTTILVVILLAGSFWVMHHMNTNMMPKHEPHVPTSARQVQDMP